MDEVLSGGKFNCQLGENRRALQLRRARNEGVGCGERVDHRRDACERLERRGRGSCYFGRGGAAAQNGRDPGCGVDQVYFME